MAKVYDAVVNSTQENVVVYKSKGNLGVYLDYDNMSADRPPAAPKWGKKEFNESDIAIGKERIV